MSTTDYTDPRTIDVDTVLGEINHAFKMRGRTWTDRLSWPNVTVKALADEIVALRQQVEDLTRERDAARTVLRNLRGWFDGAGWPPGLKAAIERVVGDRVVVPSPTEDA